MLTVYLSGPNTQQQAHAARGMPVLLSFATTSQWIERYVPSFDRVLGDSGAFSEFNSGKKIDLDGFAEWSTRLLEHPHVDAVATLDNIAGNWRQGLANWDATPWTFPVYHDTDPPEALDAILERMPGRPQWIGLGMTPPRQSRAWLATALARIEERRPAVNVHGFALRAHLDVLLRYRGRSVSVDSTNWMLDVRQILDNRMTRHLTPAEALDIVVKRYARERHTMQTDSDLPLFQEMTR